MSDIKYDSSGSANFLSHVVPEILKLVLMYNVFVFFHMKQIQMSDTATPLSPFLRFILSVRLSLGLCASEVLLYSELMHFVLIFILIWVDYSILSLKFVLVYTINIKFVWSRSADSQRWFPAFTCANSTKAFCSICFWGSILIHFP